MIASDDIVTRVVRDILLALDALDAEDSASVHHATKCLRNFADDIDAGVVREVLVVSALAEYKEYYSPDLSVASDALGAAEGALSTAKEQPGNRQVLLHALECIHEATDHVIRALRGDVARVETETTVDEPVDA